jgi:hypothetical protein
MTPGHAVGSHLPFRDILATAAASAPALVYYLVTGEAFRLGFILEVLLDMAISEAVCSECPERCSECEHIDRKWRNPN